MKRIIFLLGITFSASCSLKPTQKGIFIDTRDGHEYKWVKLGNQTWMAQNLDFLSKNSWYLNDDSANHKLYGRFYKCEIAKEVCPIGWHLPSDEEWKKLEMAAGISKSDADHDRWRGVIAKDFTEGGSTQFNVLFLGMRRQGYFDKFGQEAQFWTSTEENMPTYTRIFKKGDDRIGRNLLGAAYGCNVRCLRNDTIRSDIKER